LKNSINWLLESASSKIGVNPKDGSKFRWAVNLITLTLPSVQGYWTNTLTGATYWITDKDNIPPNHNPLTRKFTPFWLTDKYVKAVLLHRFINAARYKFRLKNYVWKVEAQATGSIHIHITSDTYMDCHALRKMWNRILRDTPVMEDFVARHGHSQPNSTDVHSVRDVRNLGAYMASYMSKKEKGKRPCGGKLWSSSNQLASTNKCSTTVFFGDDDNTVTTLVDSDIKSRVIEGKRNKLGFRDTIGEIYFMDKKAWKKLDKTPLKKMYNEHRYHIRHNLEKPPKEYYDNLLYSFEPLQLPPIISSLPSVGKPLCYVQQKLPYACDSPPSHSSLCSV